MSRRALATAAAVALTLTLSVATSGCSSTIERLNVPEGTPLNLGDLEYNVQISRFLNPADAEDMSYLEGAPSLPNDAYYFGVFLQIHNHGSSPEGLPTRYEITDTEHTVYKPVPIDNQFALPLSGKIPAHSLIPDDETIAGDASTNGLMLLFLIRSSATESRPLTLKIPAADGRHPGRIELDL